MCREIEDAAEYILDPGKGCLISGGKTILDLDVEQCGLTGYTLATDAGGAPFAAQAVQAVKDTALLESISFLRDRVTEYESVEETGSAALTDAGEVNLARIEQQAREARRAREEARREAEEAGESYEPPVPAVPPGFRNPLPVLEKLRRFSVMKLVVPEQRGLSGKKAALNTLVSGRALASGMGVIDATGGGLRGADSLAFKAYVSGYYSSYTHPSGNSCLAYQKEYILYGKKSDEKNLKAAVTRLMVLRGAANMACLYTDDRMSAQLSETAFLIGSLMLIPEAEPLIKLLLAAGWSYVESLIDVRALLEGKRIPYVKSADSWQADLSELIASKGNIGELTRDAPGGMSYDDYLAVLLLAASGRRLVPRAMDMTESEIRGAGRQEFRLDACLCAVSAEVVVRSENRVSFPVEETMDYRNL